MKADSKEKVQSISDQVKAKELERAKEKLKKDIEDSKDLTPDQKNNYKNEIANAGSVDEAENKYKEASNEIANKKAEDTKKEADKLKDAYKKMINDLQGVDQKKKDNWIKQIENAGSKQEMDSIVEFARAEEKRNQAKRTIDDLKHLNKNQKADLKDMIDQLASDDDISMTVEKAEYLDDKMNTLQELVTKAKSQEIQERKNKATTDAKTNFEKALTDSEQVSDLNNGRNADDAEVDDLINRLIDTMNKLQPNETKVEVPVSKTALEREIKRSEETKKQDLYNNASKQIKEASVSYTHLTLPTKRIV